MMRSYNLGIIEVLDLSDLGVMSYKRASKIKKDRYGYDGRRWRFPTMKEMDYIRNLSRSLGVHIADYRYYWTSTSPYQSSTLGYHMETGTGSLIKDTTAACKMILIRDL
jgi:hypothetical protein